MTSSFLRVNPFVKFPLCANANPPRDKSAKSGWTFFKTELPVVEYLTCPTEEKPGSDSRILLSVKITEINAANKAFEDLMGGETDARKRFIAENSLKVANLDI